MCFVHDLEFKNCPVSLAVGTLNLLGLSESFVLSPHLYYKLNSATLQIKCLGLPATSRG